MDTGSNRLLVAVNVESIAEVKVLTSGLSGRIRTFERPADHGRHQERHQSLPRIALRRRAATRIGTRTARSTSSTAIQKTISKQREWGYSIGGPIGKPGGNNKLFFFYAQEYQPRTGGQQGGRGTGCRRRSNAQGDFSQSTDNNGNLYSLIRDASTGLPCTTTDIRGCFQDGGVLGRIPANRLYETGLNILKTYPLPNTTAVPGAAYNFEITRPSESILGVPARGSRRLPADCQKLRGSVQVHGVVAAKANDQRHASWLHGLGDAESGRAARGRSRCNYNLNPTTFLEGTSGRAATSRRAARSTATARNSAPVRCR